MESSVIFVNLIFTNQANIIMDSGVHLSLNEKCDHQIIYLKLNLKIGYPSPYIWKVWDYNRSKTDSINFSVEILDWSYLVSGKWNQNFFNTPISSWEESFNRLFGESKFV